MHAQKLVAGALLAGITVATGEVTLLATASGVGVNWLAEGLAGLWPALANRHGDGPLAAAYAAAIRLGSRQLQAEYARTLDAHADPAAFVLVAACADTLAAAAFPAGAGDATSAQAVLGAGLDALLLGHDARQVAFLRTRLLPACATAFQAVLVRDDAAWRTFHGLLLQALAANIDTLAPKLDRYTAVLAAFSDPAASLYGLQQGIARLEASSARLETTTGATLAAVQRVEQKVDRQADAPRRSGVVFDNRGMNVQGDVNQAGTQYRQSAHATDGGNAVVVNNIGTPPRTATAPSAPDPPLTILVLAANPLDSERLRLDAEVRALDAALRQGAAGGRFDLRQQWAVRSGDLIDALLRHRPAILHFAGHGDADGNLIVEDFAGLAAPIRPAAFAALLAAVPGVRGVVLNVCWSDAQAAALLPHVEWVVGMAQEVADSAAVDFAAGFYRGLAAGETVATAVALGQAQILLAATDPDLAAEQAALVQLRVRGGGKLGE